MHLSRLLFHLFSVIKTIQKITSVIDLCTINKFIQHSHAYICTHNTHKHLKMLSTSLMHRILLGDFSVRLVSKMLISCLSRQKILKICPVPNLIQCFSKEPFYLAFRPFKSVVIDNYQHILLHKIHTLFYQT